jgi:hypothetical protein
MQIQCILGELVVLELILRYVEDLCEKTWFSQNLFVYLHCNNGVNVDAMKKLRL